MIECVKMEDFTGVADNGQEDTMVEAIKISATTTTKTKNNQEDGGASDVLQAVLNSSSSNSEQSKYSTPEPEESSDATTVTSLGHKFGWYAKTQNISKFPVTLLLRLIGSLKWLG